MAALHRIRELMDLSGCKQPIKPSEGFAKHAMYRPEESYITSITDAQALNVGMDWTAADQPNRLAACTIDEFNRPLWFWAQFAQGTAYAIAGGRLIVLPEFYPLNSRVSCMTITIQQPQCIGVHTN